MRTSAVAGTVTPNADHAVVERLRAGDEGAFRELVGRHHRAMLRVARAHVPTDAVAEEVVQEAWVGVLTGLSRFEARSSLKTWIFRIVVNRAKTRGAQERRTIAFSCIESDDAPDLDGDRFDPVTRHWRSVPRPFDLPDDRAEAAELMALVRAVIAALPPRQRVVITLRDVEGWTPAEVCDLLEISEANHRVLLHRARLKVRAAVEAERSP